MDPLKSYLTFSAFNTDGFSPYLLQMAEKKCQGKSCLF